MANIDKISVKNTVYNIVSPAVVSDYIEVIGGACTKPDGYEEDEVILAKLNDVQLLFKATQDIAFGANIVENTNCVRTTLEEVLKNAGGGGGASSADQVSYDNSDSGLEAENVQEAIDEVQGNVVSVNSALTNKADSSKAYQTDDTTETTLASDDVVPFYDTSATAKRKISVQKFAEQLISNRNLLDNPWFTVNQRGQSSYSGNVFVVDRWHIQANMSLAISDDVITVTSTSGGNFYQILPISDFKAVLGKTITISVMLSDGTIKSVTKTLPSTLPSTWTNYSDTIDGTIRLGVMLHPSYFQAFIRFEAGDSISIKAIKVELGTVSTLAMDTAPNYATELLKCQRYFQRIKKSSTGAVWFGLGIVQSIKTTSQGTITILAPMRATPTITVNGTFTLWDGITSQDVTAFHMGSGSGVTYHWDATVANDFEGAVVALYAKANVDCYIDISADL